MSRLDVPSPPPRCAPPGARAESLRHDDPRPRTVATLSEPSFVAAKKRSLEIFQREVRR